MKKQYLFISLFCFAILANNAMAANQVTTSKWDRNSAMAAAYSVDVNPAINDISHRSSLSDGEATVKKLRQIETRTDWPIPAREAALYQFTRSLKDMPRSAVAIEVMDHLKSYQSQTLVPHEDHGNTLVPLFNIRGAAAGIENSWQRQESAADGMEVLKADPGELVSGYLKDTNHARRAGYLDSLGQASIADVEKVQATALEMLEMEPGLKPGLTAMIGVSVVRTLDGYAIQQLLINGRGPGMTSTLKQLDQQLHSSDTAALLTFALQNAPAHNASLAIAAWWPRLRHEAAIRDLLVDKLADPALGGAAALALAQSPDIQTIKILQDTATGDSVAARRAQMALDINRDRLLGEVQP